MNVEGEFKNHNPERAKVDCVRLFKLRCKDGVSKVHVKEKSLQRRQLPVTVTVQVTS